MRDLPSGTVTFLFTDIEGSTKLLGQLGPEAYSAALAEHRRLLRDAFARRGGVEVDTQGDALFVAFADAAAAVQASAEAQRALATGPVRVRMGLHTGTPLLADDGYVGHDVHLGARIAAAGHGGQVLLSKHTRELIDEPLTDLGEHRVKDFAEPVWIYQLGAERFPPLKTISNTNLPRPASSFVGREREMEKVTGLLRGNARLVTLTGPGGSGKTRLAIESAAELVPQFRNGVFWVGLASLRDPNLVPDTIGQVLGARDGLAEHIGEREMLLLIDNLEQVIDAAAGLAVLVETCPNLRLLVTSRERLRVRGEVEYAVPPLVEPEAIELFVSRSGLEASNEIVELCRRLDNLPLAVELAAARANVLSPAQILERLSGRLDLLKGGRDADPRQATLRATIEWSHGLLDKDEQRLFAHLSVFAGGCTLESAEQVLGTDVDTLQSLADKSLLRLTGERFGMLETILEYAAERLAASTDADSVQQRHAEHFLVLAEEAEPHLLGPGADAWHTRLETEHDNLRRAIDHFESSGDIQRAMRLAGAIAEFWDQRGHQEEAVRRYATLLEADKSPTPARAKVLDSASMVATKASDMETAIRWAEEALAMYRDLGDARGTAVALWGLGYLRLEGGNPTEAERLLNESVRLFAVVGDETSLMWATRGLAFTQYRLGNLERARALYEENLERGRTLGDEPLQAAMLGGLSKIAVDQRRLKDAASISRESLLLFSEVRDPVLALSGVCTSASVLASLGQAVIATQLIACAGAQYEEMHAREPWIEKMNDETVEAIRKQIDQATFAEAWDQGRRLTPQDAISLAITTIDDAAVRLATQS